MLSAIERPTSHLEVKVLIGVKEVEKKLKKIDVLDLGVELFEKNGNTLLRFLSHYACYRILVVFLTLGQ